MGISLAFILAGMGTCYFGQRHAENQIPATVRAGMTDMDWVGAEWIERGLYLGIFGVLVGLLTIIINVIRRVDR